jgi:hypothetical protein
MGVSIGTIYLVSKGSYSDYGIVAAFSEKSKAEEMVELGNGKCPSDHYALLEVEIDSVFAYKDRTPFMVRMDKEGNARAFSMPVEDGPYDIDFYRSNFKDAVITNVHAKDEKHAIKIANERRIYLLSVNKWDDLFVDTR